METIDGHSAFVAEPKFYKSSPKAKFIQGLLDDGAECGISIGAIVKSTEVEKINNQDVTVYTDIELLEASFVAIPSNRHGAAMAVAKSFNNKMEASKMDEEMQKDFESKIEALEKSITEKDSQIETLTKEAEAEVVEEEVVEEVKEETKELQSEITALKEEVAELKKVPVDKGNLETVEEQTEEAIKAAEVEEAMTKGYLPVMRGN
jgi:DNA repair exonuclease SbcCD ATPase subunit